MAHGSRVRRHGRSRRRASPQCEQRSAGRARPHRAPRSAPDVLLVVGPAAGRRVLGLPHHHLAAEEADLLPVLVEALGLDGDDAAVAPASATAGRPPPSSRRRWCRRGTSGACAAASRPRGWRWPSRSRPARSSPAPASTRGCRPPRCGPCTVSCSANHALVCSGWWFIVIMQNRWSSASVIVLPGQCR